MAGGEERLPAAKSGFRGGEGGLPSLKSGCPVARAVAGVARAVARAPLPGLWQQQPVHVGDELAEVRKVAMVIGGSAVRHRQQLVDAFEGGHLPCVNGGFAVEVSSEDLAAELRAQVGQPVAAEDVLPRGRLSPGKDDVGRGLLGTGHAKKCMVNTVWLCGGELRAGGGYTLVTASCGLIDGMVALVALVACNNNKRCKRK